MARKETDNPPVVHGKFWPGSGGGNDLPACYYLQPPVMRLLMSESTLVNNDFTAKTSSFSRIVLGVASWPVIALVGLLLLTAGFVIAMMIAFRGKDLAGTP
jgi:hypothetical protein